MPTFATSLWKSLLSGASAGRHRAGTTPNGLGRQRRRWIPEWLCLWSVFGVASAAGVTSSARGESPEEFFERRVRPVLAASCYACHGPQKQEANLRLDSRESILRGGDGGPVVTPGNSAASRLVTAVHWEGDLQMPPERKLEPSQIEALTRWVALGLPWPRDGSGGSPAEPWRHHWAFQPIRSPAPPAVTDPCWPRTAMDRFVRAELAAGGRSPSPAADRRTLIRRATLDLLGLPPSVDEVEQFVGDPAPTAYERLIDRLLASPHYGERWGRHWLDVARYADTKGYVFFEDKRYPWAYTYRDYVIEAWNADLPYDQFVLQQLAADQPGGATGGRDLRALGFLTVGSHFMNNTHDIIDDRIDVVTRGLLGLTVTCGRCHDHKYDPITADDYYALYGVFRSSYEPTVPPLYEPPPDTEAYRKFAEELANRERKLVEFVTARHQELVRDARVRAGDYLWAAYERRDQPPTDDFMLLVDKGDLNPTLILRWQVYLSERRTAPGGVWSLWQALAALSSDEFPRRAADVVRDLGDREVAGIRVNRRVREALERAPLASLRDVAQRYGNVLREVEEEWQRALAAARPSRGDPPARLPDPDAEELRQVLYGDEAPPDVPLAMDWGFLSLFPDRPTQGEYQKLLKELEQWLMTAEGSPPRAMVLYDSARPHAPRVFLRGNPHRLGATVERRFLSLLGGRPFRDGSGRRELAEAVVDPANPLAARVIVNRIWMHHFGEGLVRTPSDFGVRSEPPELPQLLDWLAAGLIEHGWSLKWLQREILLSSVYRQSAWVTGSDAASDTEATGAAPEAGRPERAWLGQFPRRRLEFETMRDAMLAVADALDPRLGGPPVEILGDRLVPRRTIYGLLDRMDVPPLLTTFDFPNPLTTSPQRVTTTLAPQALFLMNSPFVAEIAERMVQRPEICAATEPRERLARLYLLCFARRPTDAETAAASRFLGAAPTDDDWRRLAHGLLLTNEFSVLE